MPLSDEEIDQMMAEATRREQIQVSDEQSNRYNQAQGEVVDFDASINRILSQAEAETALKSRQKAGLQDAPPLIQRTSEALSSAGKLLKPFTDLLPTQTGRDAKEGSMDALKMLGQREGIPLDVKSGAGFFNRLGADLVYSQEQKRAVLSMMPNVQNVRFNSLGDPVLTIKSPKTGEIRDVLANPVGIESGDFAFVAANLPELIMGGLAAKGFKATKKAAGMIQKVAQYLFEDKGMIASAGRMAAAGQGAGAIKDVVSDIGFGQPIDIGEIGEIGERRGVNSLADFIFGIGFGMAGKVISKSLSPLGKRGPIQVDAEAAAELWDVASKKAGVDLKFDLTPGEASGNPFLLKTESFLGGKPGSSAPFERMMEARKEALGKMQSIMLGTDPASVPAADIVGQRALETAVSKIAPMDWFVSRETGNLLKAAQTEMMESVRLATKIPTPVEMPAVGGKLFEAAETKFQQFRADSKTLYDKVNNSPFVKGQGRNIDVSQLARDAQAIKDEVAAVQKMVEKPTGILDQFGKPETKTVTETETLNSFVNSSTISKLDQLINAEKGFMSLRDLTELRRDIDDELFRGSVISGLPERRLGKLRETLTKRIEGGLKEIDPSGQTLADWKAASAHYRDNMRLFKDVDIMPMFKDNEHIGSLGLNRVVSRALNNADMWEAYKGFFGEASTEMNLLRRRFADQIVGRTDGSNTVDAAGFLSRLDRYYETQPQITDDVFGNQLSRIKGFALAAGQAGRKQVNVDELVNHLERGSLTDTALRNLISTQDERAAAYRNSLVARISKGTGPGGIVPSEFVDNVIFKGEPDEINQVLGMLSHDPDLMDQIRQRTLLKIFNESTGKVAGREMISSKGLNEFLGDEIMAKRLSFLGEDTLDLIRATHDLLKPGDLKYERFKSGGGIAGGMQISAMERAISSGDSPKVWGEVSSIVKSFLLSSIYKTGPVRNFLANTDFSKGGTLVDQQALINAFIVSEPVAEDLIRVFGKESGQMAAIQLKEAVDGSVRERNSDGTKVKALTDAEIDAMMDKAIQKSKPTPRK